MAPLLSIGLFGFSWTSLGPPQVHWIAPMIFSALIAIANVRLTGALFEYENANPETTVRNLYGNG